MTKRSPPIRTLPSGYTVQLQGLPRQFFLTPGEDGIDRFDYTKFHDVEPLT